MKRILIIPIQTSGVVDVRQLDYLILDNVKYLEQIQNNLLAKKKKLEDYKFCQFEEKAIIPFFIKIKDKLGNGMQEFDVEKVMFKEINGTDEYIKSLIEEKYLQPIQQKLDNVLTQANLLIVKEKLGDKIEEEQFINLALEKEQIEKEINEFNYKTYLNEIV